MKSAKFLALSLFLFTISLVACNKNTASGDTSPTVYVSGFIDTLGQTKAACWINDSLQIVADPTQFNGVAFANNSLYLLDQGGYWINNLYTALPTALNTFTRGVVVSGSDVYVTGFTSVSASTATAAAIYWKNGVQVNLTQNIPGVTNAFITSIFVSGTDVYAAGLLAVGYRNGQGVYWKNDSLVYLPDCYMPEAISVAGGNVYVAGLSLVHGSVYWANGNEIPLPGNGSVNAMAVSGNDVYIAGNASNGPDQAVYWKNGQMVPLPNGSSATGITVVGKDIYVCGNGGSNQAVYWKNGVIHLLREGGATGIAVN